MGALRLLDVRCALTHVVVLAWRMVRSGNEIGAAGAASLAPALRELTGLTQLDLGGE